MNHLALTIGQLRYGLAYGIAHIAPRVVSSRLGQSLNQLLALAAQTVKAGVTYRRHRHRVRSPMVLQRLVSSPQSLLDICHSVLSLDLNSE